MSKLIGRGVKVFNDKDSDVGVIVCVDTVRPGPVRVAFGEGYIECFHYTQLRYLNNRKVVI